VDVRTAADYQAELLALLPRGGAWEMEPDSVLAGLHGAVAEELARIDGRAAALIEEMDPRTTFELLIDWERAFGLPDPCTDAADTVPERQAVLHEKVTRIGGQSAAYYIALAARLGYAITITEYRPHYVSSPVDYPLYDDDWWFVWQVNAPEETVTYHLVDGGVDEPLADWGNDILECAIGRLKPAHTHVIFAYGG